MKKWRHWHEVCDGCASPTQRFGEEDSAHGDTVRCRKCYCQGRLALDFLGLYADWPDDVCALCYRDLDARAEDIADRIISWMKAYEPAVVAPFTYGELIAEDLASWLQTNR